MKILIDDDRLIHLSWQMAARKANIDLKTFFTVEEFLSYSINLPRKTKIYIDSDLSNGIRGEVESKKIFNAGFKEIYLATGYNASEIKCPAWIKAIIGKRPEFFNSLSTM